MSFERSIHQALRLMPRHRANTSRRANSLGLDDLIDEARERDELDSGALDLLLMGTRFRARALKELASFLKGKDPKPAELEDLFVLVFASLLSRDRMPAPVQLNTFVEITGKTFGPHLKGLVNAWGRQLLRSREALETERSQDPATWLPDNLRRRWKNHPALLAEAARRSFARPEPGVWAFGTELKLKKKALSEWQQEAPFQAMDPGSWRLVEWIHSTLGNTTTSTFLDACAAPGGKFIALSLLRRKQGLLRALATDSKYPRLQRLERNIAAWKERLAPDTSSTVLAWGEDSTPNDVATPSWDLVLADLPCSGSGTLHTRPDLLDRDPFERLDSLSVIQQKIIASLRTLKIQDLFVSVCSVDPEEIRALSQALGKEPDFSSWAESAGDEEREGLTAWHLARH